MQRVRRYLIRNCAAILPPALAATVFVLAHFLFSLASDCPNLPSIASLPQTTGSISVGNPFFCKPGTLIAAAFDTAWRRPGAIGQLGPVGTQTPPNSQTDTIVSYQTGMFKEAKAHLLWLGSFVGKMIICVAAIIGLAWVIIVQFEDYCFDQNWGYYGWSAPGVVALLAGSLLCTAAVYIAMFIGLQLTMLPGLNMSLLIATGFYGLDDSVASYADTALLPAGHRLITFSDVLITLDLLMLVMAVTMTLFQHPTHAERRTTTVRDEPYEALLLRNFQRLTLCIYTGALLLVVSVVELGARYAWPGSLIGPPTGVKSTDLYKDLTDAFSQLSSQIQFGYGLVFTLILAALFFPAWTVLRRRAWQLVRTIPNLASPADQDKWLADHKMAFTTYQQFGQFIAILAPAGLGSLAAVMKLVGAG